MTGEDGLIVDATPADDSGKKKPARRAPEWRRYGDPRNSQGRFRPKKNLKTLYGKGKRWTRESLAKAMGMKDPRLISRWASGERYMDDEAVVRCAMAAGVSVSWLLDQTSHPLAQSWPPDFPLGRQKILRDIREFSDGVTDEELSDDYLAATEYVEAYERQVEETCLELSGVKDIEEFRRLQVSGDDTLKYVLMETNARSMVVVDPWVFERAYEEYELPRAIVVDAEYLSRMLGDLEKAYPGDCRSSEHLAQAMLHEIMRYYPGRMLENMSGLLNQASRMSRSGEDMFIV